MEMNFFDWTYLGTFAGALAAVALITELTKNLPFIKKIPTQLFSWILGFGVLILAQVFGGSLSAQNAVLAVFNGGMVSLAANGGYAALKRVMEGSGSNQEESADEKESAKT